MKKTIFCVALLALVFSFGCGKRENVVVATVDGRKITVGDLEGAGDKIAEKFLPRTNDQAGKMELLNHMIDKEVMALTALSAGYEKDKGFVDFFEKYKAQYALAAMENVYIRQKVTVTDQEAKDYFDKMHKEYTLSQILVSSEDEARSIREQLMHGADFAELAKKYSLGREAGDGGLLGESSIGSMFYWIEEALFTAKEGDITQPLETPEGWTILKVHKIKTITPEKDLTYARQKVRADKEKKMIEGMKHKIEKEIGLQIFPQAVDIVYNNLPPDVPFGDIVEHRVTYDNAPKLEIPEQYQDMILAQYSEGSYKLKDYMKIYEDTGLPERPRRQYGKESIIMSIHKKIFDTMLPVYAEKNLKVFEIPEVAKDFQEKKEMILVSLLYKNQVTEQATVSDLDVQDYYNKHKNELNEPEKRAFSIILVSDKAKADLVASLAKKGENFASLAKKYSEDPSAAQNKVSTDLVQKGHYPDYDEKAFSMAKGEVSDPVQVPRGWAVIKVDQIEKPQPQPYANAAFSIRQALQSQQAEKVITEKLAKWRKDYPIKIYDRNLKKVELKKTRPSDAELQQKEQEQQKQQQSLPPVQ
ncbi:MAG: peptidyl-prolyl cis-trans isomerase [Candidatus Krumholzibacteriaceae bacterium]